MLKQFPILRAPLHRASFPPLIVSEICISEIEKGAPLDIEYFERHMAQDGLKRFVDCMTRSRVDSIFMSQVWKSSDMRFTNWAPTIADTLSMHDKLRYIEMAPFHLRLNELMCIVLDAPLSKEEMGQIRPLYSN